MSDADWFFLGVVVGGWIVAWMADKEQEWKKEKDNDRA